MRVQRIWPNIILLSLLWGLVACGETARPAPQANTTGAASAAKPLATLKELEQLLNQGQVDKALDLFDPGAELVEEQPLHLISRTSIQTGYVRAISHGDREIYQGRDRIRTYLFTIVYNHFQSAGSSFALDGDFVTWECEAYMYDLRLQMAFKATVAGDKILSLTATNLNLDN